MYYMLVVFQLHNILEVGDLVKYVNMEDTGYSSFHSATDIFNTPLSPTPIHSSSPTTMPVEEAEMRGLGNLIQLPVMPSDKSLKVKTAPKHQPVQNLVDFQPSCLFQKRVETAIEGNFLPVRKHLISNIGTIYLVLTSHPNHGDYKRMAVLICEKFPELKDASASYFWVRNQHVLSAIP